MCVCVFLWIWLLRRLDAAIHCGTATCCVSHRPDGLDVSPWPVNQVVDIQYLKANNNTEGTSTWEWQQLIRRIPSLPCDQVSITATTATTATATSSAASCKLHVPFDGSRFDGATILKAGVH